LFPDTYDFFVVNGLEDNPAMDTAAYAEVAARTVYAHFNRQMSGEMYRRMNDMGFTLDEFITLASMVQWEAAELEDMQKVAAVFLNRMRNPDRFPLLQSDVTEKYANQSIRPYLIGDNIVLFESMMTTYNTYDSPGLPPGPVNNPGMMAMLAVLDAPRLGFDDYFYFCANIDTGEVFFAKTLVEHEANLARAGIVL
jgi:UPF0755 protein